MPLIGRRVFVCAIHLDFTSLPNPTAKYRDQIEDDMNKAQGNSAHNRRACIDDVLESLDMTVSGS